MYVKRKTKPFVFFRKTVALFVSLCFILSESVSYASSSLRASEGGAVISGSEIASVATLPRNDEVSTISIPESLGQIEESWLSSSESRVSSFELQGKLPSFNPKLETLNSKLVIYIQDAHDSLEAQENIAKLIHYFVEHYGVKTVFEEGYEGPVPTDEYFGFIQDPEIKEKVSYFLMDKLRIGGAEYAHINRCQKGDRSLSNPTKKDLSPFCRDFKLIGADSIPLHLKNIRWYRRMVQRQEETQKDLTQIQKEMGKLASLYLPRELKDWMKLKKRFEEDQMTLLDYVKRIIQEKGILPKDYPRISLLLLTEKSQEKEILEKAKAIDTRGLFQELNRLENDFASSFLKSERDQRIFRYHKGLSLLTRLQAMKLTAEEYEALKGNLTELKTESLAHFLAQNLHQSLILSKRWEGLIRNAVQFYETAQARDHSLESRLDSFLQDPHEKIAILVFGGFHKNSIQEILTRKKLSYAIVSPKISSPSPRHQAYYQKLMSAGYHAFEIPLLLPRASRPMLMWELPRGQSEVQAVDQSLERVLRSHHEFPLSRDELWRAVEEDLTQPRSEAREKEGVSGVNVSSAAQRGIQFPQSGRLRVPELRDQLPEESFNLLLSLGARTTNPKERISQTPSPRQFGQEREARQRIPMPDGRPREVLNNPSASSPQFPGDEFRTWSLPFLYGPVTLADRLILVNKYITYNQYSRSEARSQMSDKQRKEALDKAIDLIVPRYYSQDPSERGEKEGLIQSLKASIYPVNIHRLAWTVLSELQFPFALGGLVLIGALAVVFYFWNAPSIFWTLLISITAGLAYLAGFPYAVASRYLIGDDQTESIYLHSGRVLYLMGRKVRPELAVHLFLGRYLRPFQSDPIFISALSWLDTAESAFDRERLEEVFRLAQRGGKVRGQMPEMTFLGGMALGLNLPPAKPQPILPRIEEQGEELGGFLHEETPREFYPAGGPSIEVSGKSFSGTDRIKGGLLAGYAYVQARKVAGNPEDAFKLAPLFLRTLKRNPDALETETVNQFEQKLARAEVRSEKLRFLIIGQSETMQAYHEALQRAGYGEETRIVETPKEAQSLVREGFKPVLVLAEEGYERPLEIGMEEPFIVVEVASAAEKSPEEAVTALIKRFETPNIEAARRKKLDQIEQVMNEVEREIEAEKPGRYFGEPQGGQIQYRGSSVRGLVRVIRDFDEKGLMKPGKKFGDIGAGIGRMLAAAVVLTDVGEAVGIEMDPYLVQKGKQAIDRLHKMKVLDKGRIRWIQKDWRNAMDEITKLAAVYMYPPLNEYAFEEWADFIRPSMPQDAYLYDAAIPTRSGWGQRPSRSGAEIQGGDQKDWETKIREALTKRDIREATRLYTNHRDNLTNEQRERLKQAIYEARKRDVRAEVRSQILQPLWHPETLNSSMEAIEQKLGFRFETPSQRAGFRPEAKEILRKPQQAFEIIEKIKSDIEKAKRWQVTARKPNLWETIFKFGTVRKADRALRKFFGMGIDFDRLYVSTEIIEEADGIYDPFGNNIFLYPISLSKFWTIFEEGVHRLGRIHGGGFDVEWLEEEFIYSLKDQVVKEAGRGLPPRHTPDLSEFPSHLQYRGWLEPLINAIGLEPLVLTYFTGNELFLTEALGPNGKQTFQLLEAIQELYSSIFIDSAGPPGLIERILNNRGSLKNLQLIAQEFPYLYQKKLEIEANPTDWSKVNWRAINKGLEVLRSQLEPTAPISSKQWLLGRISSNAQSLLRSISETSGNPYLRKIAQQVLEQMGEAPHTTRRSEVRNSESKYSSIKDRGQENPGKGGAYPISKNGFFVPRPGDARSVEVAIYESRHVEPSRRIYREHFEPIYTDVRDYLEAQGITAAQADSIISSPNHSIVIGIPTYDSTVNIQARIDYFKKVLDELKILRGKGSPYKNWPVELVINVNGLGQGKFLEALLQFQRDYSTLDTPITVIHMPLGGRLKGEQLSGKSNVLNAIMEYARSKKATIVGFMDDDIGFSKGNVLSNINFLIQKSRELHSPILTGSQWRVAKSDTWYRQDSSGGAHSIKGTSMFGFIFSLPPLPPFPLNEDLYLRIYFADLEAKNPFWRIHANPEAPIRWSMARSFVGILKQEYRWELGDQWVFSLFEGKKDQFRFRRYGWPLVKHFIQANIDSRGIVQTLKNIWNSFPEFFWRDVVINHFVSLELWIRQILGKPRFTTNWSTSVPVETKDGFRQQSRSEVRSEKLQLESLVEVVKKDPRLSLESFKLSNIKALLDQQGYSVPPSTLQRLFREAAKAGYFRKLPGHKYELTTIGENAFELTSAKFVPRVKLEDLQPVIAKASPLENLMLHTVGIGGMYGGFKPAQLRRWPLPLLHPSVRQSPDYYVRLAMAKDYLYDMVMNDGVIPGGNYIAPTRRGIRFAQSIGRSLLDQQQGRSEVRTEEKERDVDALIQQLDLSRHYLDIVHAAGALGNLGDRRAVEPLLELLNYRNGKWWDSVLIAAAEALGKLKDPQAIMLLGTLLQEKSERVREAAKEALLQISPTSYYGIQRERILATLFAKDLKVLLDYTKRQSVDSEHFGQVAKRLRAAYVFEEFPEIVIRTGGMSAWNETWERMDREEVKISAQTEQSSDQIFQIDYMIPKAHFRNHYLIFENFYATLRDIARLQRNKEIQFLKDELPPNPEPVKRPPWADSGDEDWQWQVNDLYESARHIQHAIPYLLETGFANSADAVFKRLERGTEAGIIHFSTQIDAKNNFLVFSISDNGDGIITETLEHLASGTPYESQKNKIEQVAGQEKSETERRGIYVAYDLEKADFQFELKNRQVRGHGRGIHQTAALIGAYGGILEIDTHNKEGQKLKLVFGQNGLPGQINADLDLPIPVGTVTEGSRPEKGTTFVIRLPLQIPSQAPKYSSRSEVRAQRFPEWIKRKSIVSMIKGKFAERAELSFADLDTGTGEFVSKFEGLLKSSFQKVEGIGVEPLGVLVKEAHKQKRNVVHANAQIEGDYEKVWLADHSKDIVMVNNIESAPEALLAQASRILKSDGLLIVTFEKWDIAEGRGIDKLVKKELQKRGFYFRSKIFPKDYPSSEKFESNEFILIAWKKERPISDSSTRSEVRRNPRETVSRFQEKYAVVVDMKVFDALSEEQQIEFKKLIHARPDVKFVFNMAGERQLDPALQELMDFRDRYKNIEIRIDPASFDFQGRKIINVSKEGIQAPYADFIERRLSQSKDLHRVRYREDDGEAGLLTAALLLLESKPEEFIRQGRYFSEVPLGLKAQIEQFLLTYVYVGRSA